MPEMSLDIYGITARVTAPESVLNRLKLDFSFFISAGGEEEKFRLDIFESNAPFERIPEVKASLYQPDSVAYDSGPVRYIDYHGRALSIYDYGTEKGELYSRNADILHELAYLFILSRSGEMLDGRGIHRVHALGFSVEGKGVICLMPQGVGKTTLALELLKDPAVKLISDDTPLISGGSRLLPFPLRIGVDDTVKLDVPTEYLGYIERRKYGRKTLIDIRYFSGHISGPAGIDYIFTGLREFSAKPRILKAAKTAVFRTLLRDCVVGLGLPQMIEHFLRFGAGEIMLKAGIMMHRAAACFKAVYKARAHTLIVGRDTTANVKVLLDFVKSGK